MQALRKETSMRRAVTFFNEEQVLSSSSGSLTDVCDQADLPPIPLAAKADQPAKRQHMTLVRAKSLCEEKMFLRRGNSMNVY